MMTHKTLALIIFLSCFFSASAFSQEIITIESQVTGSKEQPKVISIVPWQEPTEPDYYGEDVSGLEETEQQAKQLFMPIDRASFVQEVKYIQTMRKK